MRPPGIVLRHRWRIVAAAGMCVVLTATSGCSSDGAKKSRPTTTVAGLVQRSAKLTIAELLPLDGQFDAFVDYAGTAEVLTELDAKGPFTLFAPGDEALRTMPAEQLDPLLADRAGAMRRYLDDYIVEGRVGYVDLVSGKVTSVTAVSGRVIPVAVDAELNVTVGGALVTKHDITASNGVVHVLGSVYAPD